MLSLLLEPLPAFSVCFLTNPGPPAQGQHRPQWAGTTYHINQKKKKCTTGLPAVQTGGGDSSAEVLLPDGPRLYQTDQS